MNLLNPFNLESHYSIFFSADHIGFDDEKLFIVLDSKNTIFLGLTPAKFGNPDIPNYYVYQLEIRKESIKWLIDCIEKKFWLSAAQGGLPKGQYSYKEDVDGETLALYREMNMGAKGQKGFRFTNFSRPNRKRDKKFQDFFVTDIMLIEGGLLDELKKIISL
ncbi:hypothetical protein [Pseudoalteromonas sp. P1-7a]|uniref:hypothetical protein n=1 Tax=Pseudoalteromonas sp. P1-7a TaxID=1723755 RepID=UPI0006D67438|nr:hypothetical protein [Pseudoalteromonas sp. P1-7a]KPZ59322.1 hypothetical protein AN389_02753 [Pseudoalteromonas sp. P1-7a]